MDPEIDSLILGKLEELVSSPNLEVQERASTALQASNLFLLLFFRFFIEDLRACFPMSDKSDSDLAHLEKGHTLRIFDMYL